MDLLLNWKCGTVCAEVSLRPETLRPVGRRIFCWTRCSGAGSSTPWWTTLIGHFGCWVYRLWLKFGGFELRYIICIQMVSYDDFLKCSQSMGFNFNWSKFGWFVGTPISGNLHMNHRNVLHIHVKIVQHQPSAKDQGNDSEWGTCGCRHLPPLLRSDSPWPSMIQLLGLKSSEAKDSHGGLFFLNHEAGSTRWFQHWNSSLNPKSSRWPPSLGPVMSFWVFLFHVTHVKPKPQYWFKLYQMIKCIKPDHDNQTIPTVSYDA